MTDTPQPTPADKLLQRVAYLLCETKATNEMFPREDDYDIARAIVALVLDEAANIAQDLDLGHETNPYAWPERISEAIRAMIQEKPHD